MKKKICCIFYVVSVCLFSLQAKDQYKFRVWFTDKNGSEYRLDNPAEFLSERSVMRRTKQAIVIDSTDLPVNDRYVKEVESLGAKRVVSSKWLNTAVFMTDDSLTVAQIKRFSFVSKVDFVWKGQDKQPEETAQSDSHNPIRKHALGRYGDGHTQISMLGAHRLHKKGYKGKGIEIAVIDAGFSNVDNNAAINRNLIRGTYDFVNPGSNVYEGHSHGALVLSTMAAYMPGHFVGTAPEAGYWLLKTEDNRSEYPVEEDYWTAAIEFADSVGADLVTSSLGYSKYQNEMLNYHKNDLDGKTAVITKAAGVGAKKGMIVVSSAGNEKETEWQKIMFPGDAAEVLTVGSVDCQKNPSSFSGIGFTTPVVKPDIVTMGSQTAMIAPDGKRIVADGTSFATPLAAGVIACLWQALPQYTAKEIVYFVRRSGSRSANPDMEVGYGVPDIWSVYKKYKKR